ncbi:MAG: amidohydrolase [Bacteroidetes bacterium]|nr:MAG: amidohydrolase [Bacteroidota bacterium]
MNELKVSVIQFDIFWENPEKNRNYLDDTLKNGSADLFILPEMWSTGFSMQPDKCGSQDEALTWMQKKAQEKSAAICGSLIMLNEADQYVNRLFFVYPDGQYEYYDKRHLFTMGDEPNHYSPGKSRLIVEYKGWRICPLICYDLRFPVFARNNAAYDLLIYVANWPAKRAEHWKALVKARAIENQSYLLACNRVGVDANGVDHVGDSVVYDYKGESLATSGSLPEVLNATLILEELKEGREKFPVLADRDPFTADWA